MKDTAKSPLTVPSTKANTRWGPDRRQAFIDFRLQWEGRINRSDITSFFGISVPQASLDIASYTEQAPHNLAYDRSSRVYQATTDFRPLYEATHPQQYLNELLAATGGSFEPEASFIGWLPPTGCIPQPGRTVTADTLSALLKAMKEAKGLKVVYQSMSKPEPSSRTISPHAFAYDGFRWHVRAFCHKREEFLDFVLGRILEVQGFESARCTANEDREWFTELTLVLAPHPELSAGQRRVIELDYGMNDGEVALRCRQALLFYTLKRLGLDKLRLDQPEAQQIVLKNEAELASFLVGTKISIEQTCTSTSV
ncbi:WYL domain-containing protein [Iodobacter fluviatilis]|nr:WYL domain-containing protein [Iodobacter fluviatilis]